MNDHETTLLSEAKRFGRLAEQFIGSAPREGQARRAERDAAVESLRAAEKLLIQVVEERRLAGADALRRATQTCGNCKWFVVWFKDGVTANGHPENRGDCQHRRYLGRRNGQSPDDGCIKGYAPPEPTR